MKCEDWSGGIGDILGKMAGPLKVKSLPLFILVILSQTPKSL